MDASLSLQYIDDIKNKPLLGKLVREKIFERYIILNNQGCVGNLEEIYDERGTVLFRAD